MLTAEAVVHTDNANRHLAQLCRHAGKMVDSPHIETHSLGGGHVPPEIESVDCTESEGVIAFRAGRCVIRATSDALTLRVEAADEESLRRIQHLIASRLEAIGSREQLNVSW